MKPTSLRMVTCPLDQAIGEPLGTSVGAVSSQSINVSVSLDQRVPCIAV